MTQDVFETLIRISNEKIQTKSSLIVCYRNKEKEGNSPDGYLMQITMLKKDIVDIEKCIEQLNKPENFKDILKIKSFCSSGEWQEIITIDNGRRVCWAKSNLEDNSTILLMNKNTHHYYVAESIGRDKDLFFDGEFPTHWKFIDR